MEQKSITSSARTQDALYAFLNLHVGIAFSDDVGPLLGQAALVSETSAADAGMKRYWNDAVSAALTAEVARDPVRPARRPAKVASRGKHRAR